MEVEPISYTLITPSRSAQFVEGRYTSTLGLGGSEGYVRPAVINFEGQEKQVQIKRFRNCYIDETTGPCHQDPEEEAVKSYKNFQLLEGLGITTVPFYALGIDENGKKYVVMTDLSQGGQLEVLDEKIIEQGKKDIMHQNGLRVEYYPWQRYYNLTNLGQVNLERYRNRLLGDINGIDLGVGPHMITRDPNTNIGETYVADVGEVWQLHSMYTDAVDLPNFIAVPEDEIFSLFSRILSQHHPDADPRKVYDSYLETSPVKKQFQDLFYQAAIARGLRRDQGCGTSGSDIDWGKKRFARVDFDLHLIDLKMALMYETEAFAQSYGSSLFETSQKAQEMFLKGGNNRSLLVGIDLAYWATLDSKIRHLPNVFTAVHTKTSPPAYDPDVAYGGTGLPYTRFFENYFDKETTVFASVLVDPPTWMRDSEIKLTVETGWRKAQSIETGKCLGYNAYISPSEVNEVSINGQPLPDFDPKKLKVKPFFSSKDPDVGNSVTYVYKRDAVYWATITTPSDLEQFKQDIKRQKR